MRRSERSEVLGAWGILTNKRFLHRVYTDALLAKDECLYGTIFHSKGGVTEYR